MIQIVAKSEVHQNIHSKFPNAIIIDFTCKGNLAIDHLNPYYPYRDIPVPNSGGAVAESVGSIWQGLKVFEKRDLDEELIRSYTFNRSKLNTQNYGDYLGHRYGTHGLDLLDISDARRRILVPTYKWLLDYKVQDVIVRIREANKNRDIIFIDRVADTEAHDFFHHISHVYLIKAYIEGLWPYENVFEVVVNHHYYSGRKELHWTTHERHPKMIEPYVFKKQLEIPFDIV